VCCFPPCGVSPRGVWGLCPLRSSDDAFSMMMSPHAEPTSGCSAPDSGWQSAAARPGTTLSVPAPGRPPGHHQDASSMVIAGATARTTKGFPKKRVNPYPRQHAQSGSSAPTYLRTHLHAYARTDSFAFVKRN